MHRLGLAEINGELGLSKRPREGVKWLKRAAELADQVDPPQPQSLHELAVLHEKGIENVVFQVSGRLWVSTPFPFLPLRLARRPRLLVFSRRSTRPTEQYADPTPLAISQDEEYAAELLARASELQFAPSAYKLGECYEYGKMGCPQDSALSIHYYSALLPSFYRLWKLADFLFLALVFLSSLAVLLPLASFRRQQTSPLSRTTGKPASLLPPGTSSARLASSLNPIPRRTSGRGRPPTWTWPKPSMPSDTSPR